MKYSIAIIEDQKPFRNLIYDYFSEKDNYEIWGEFEVVSDFTKQLIEILNQDKTFADSNIDEHNLLMKWKTDPNINGLLERAFNQIKEEQIQKDKEKVEDILDKFRVIENLEHDERIKSLKEEFQDQKKIDKILNFFEKNKFSDHFEKRSFIKKEILVKSKSLFPNVISLDLGYKLSDKNTQTGDYSSYEGLQILPLLANKSGLNFDVYVVTTHVEIDRFVIDSVKGNAKGYIPKTNNFTSELRFAIESDDLFYLSRGLNRKLIDQGRKEQKDDEKGIGVKSILDKLKGNKDHYNVFLGLAKGWSRDRIVTDYNIKYFDKCTSAIRLDLNIEKDNWRITSWAIANKVPEIVEFYKNEHGIHIQ